MQTGRALRRAAHGRRLRRSRCGAAVDLRLATQYAFAGYSALSPLLVAALFWRGSTKWGALAATLWTAFAVIYTARTPGALAWGGLMPVVPMTFISCALMAIVSLVTPPPSAATIARYRGRMLKDAS